MRFAARKKTILFYFFKNETMNDYNSSLHIQATKHGQHPNFRIISFSGDMDQVGLQGIRDDVEKTEQDIQDDEKFLVFDFEKLNFINSEGIGFLLKIQYRLLKHGKKLVVVAALPNVKDVLDVVGLLKIVDYHDTMAAFAQTV